MKNKLNIEDVNKLNKTKFLNIFANIYEHSLWIAEDTYNKKPFNSIKDLHHKFIETLKNSDENKKLTLIKAHPDLAGKLAQIKNLTAESTKEQKSLALDSLSEKDFNFFTENNKKYHQKFNFPFIICVKNHTLMEIKKNFTSRLNNDINSEKNTAINEINNIALHRLKDIINS